MSDGPIKLPDWLPPALKEDPKKTLVLGVLCVVFVGFVARCFLGGPARASASASGIASARPAIPPVTSVKAPTPSRQYRTESAVRLWVKQPVPAVPRDLFRIRTELFPRATSQNVDSVQVKPSFWDAVEKSEAQQADENKQRLILVQNLRREAAKLELQSTMMGPNPQAIISGTMVQAGSVVASGDGGMQFRVLKIEATDVIVEREGVQLRLRMPG